MSDRAPDILPFSQAFHATVEDADEVRSILERKLPPELALQIASLAGYNPWLAARRVLEREYHVSDLENPADEYRITGLYLSTRPIPENGRRIVPQRIIFQTRAADQGWADAGGYFDFHNSHTWFEVSILRPYPLGTKGDMQNEALEDVLPNPWRIAVTKDASPLRNDLRDKGWDFVEAEDGRITWRVCNIIMASSMYRDYKVEWARGGQEELEDERTIGTGEGFLELLEPGFIVVLWARAERYHWRNRVEAATIEIEYEL